MKSLFFVLLFPSLVYCANWLMLQGSEKKAGFHPWGFVQVRYENNEGNEVISSGINKTPFSYIKPDLENQSELQLARLRLGIRGSFDDANKINYFFLTELAPNGINNHLGYNYNTFITDASVTFKYFPIYLRFGQYKYAGSEEGNMARFVSPFINFSTVGNQLMLERFVDSTLDKPRQGVGAYRDLGVQFFQRYKLDDTNHLTLSYMLGNGSGLEFSKIDKDTYTHYGYISYENQFGKGKGYKQESLKLYAWLQEGKRKLNYPDEVYDRDRYGFGFTYYQNSLRVEAEYMKGKGGG